MKRPAVPRTLFAQIALLLLFTSCFERDAAGAEVFIGNSAQLVTFDMSAGGGADSGLVESTAPIFLEQSFPRASGFVMSGAFISHMRWETPSWAWDPTHTLSENGVRAMSAWSDLFTVDGGEGEGEAVFTFHLNGELGGEVFGEAGVLLNGDSDHPRVQWRFGSAPGDPNHPYRDFGVFRVGVGYQHGVPFTITAGLSSSGPGCCGRHAFVNMSMTLVDITIPAGATLRSQRNIVYPQFPILSTERLGENIAVRWARGEVTYRLERAILGSGIWYPVEREPYLTGDTYTFVEAIGDTSVIFRLAR